MIETLLLLVVFSSIATIVAVVSFQLKDSVQAELDRTQALAYAEEGLTALYFLRDSDADNLNEGTHGLVYNNGEWSLSGSEDSYGKFSRTITIHESEGDIFTVVCTVSWDGVRADTISLSSTLYDIFETYGVSEYIVPESASAQWNAQHTEIQNMSISNSDVSSHTVVAMTLSWQGDSRLQEIYVGSSTIYSVATSSAVQSGEQITVNNFTLSAGEMMQLSRIVFTEPVDGALISMQLELEDGTIRNSMQNIE